MKSTAFTYTLPKLKESAFPDIPLPKGAKIACIVQPHGEVQLVGDSAGLAYLAKHLAAMSMITNTKGLHIHLDAELGQVDAGSSLLTIRNLDFERASPE